jgi:hypothetical protein
MLRKAEKHGLAPPCDTNLALNTENGLCVANVRVKRALDVANSGACQGVQRGKTGPFGAILIKAPISREGFASAADNM